MTSRAPQLRVLAGTAVAVALCGSLLQQPAHAATVTFQASKSVSASNSLVTFSGSAANSAGKTVALQRRTGTGPWQTLGTKKVSSSSTFSFALRVALGTHSYRAVIAGAGSAARAVAGVYGRSVQTPNTGAPFTLYGQLPTARARPVHVQFQSGNRWFTRKVGGSSSTGFASVPIFLTCSARVRMYAPATSSLPALVAPPLLINVGGIDTATREIFCDTNAYRLANGRKELTLFASLNNVANAWAKKMHDDSTAANCALSFKHNPNYTAEYPLGWTRAAENIAAGQTYSTVVSSWINSAGHRANILGDYNRIGIGYYSGPKCYNRYFVQNFAKY